MSAQLSSLHAKKIILGVSGSIAAYKSPLLLRELVKRGAEVRVVITPSATNFVTPLVLQNLSKNPVAVEMFERSVQADGSWHIHLARWADAMIIAPCSAKSLAAIAHGFCDTALGCVALALPQHIPFILAPAMDSDMWEHPATQANLEIVKKQGARIIQPESGELASGLIGMGRMPEPLALADYMEALFASPTHASTNTEESSTQENEAPKTQEQTQPEKIITQKEIDEVALRSSHPLADAVEQDAFDANLALEQLKRSQLPQTSLAGKTVLITAGPTYEKIDDVRFIGNYSSGKMGYALAEAARDADAKVILVSGPVALPAPENVYRFMVHSAQEMHEVVMPYRESYDIAILAAAVADFTPVHKAEGKIKKSEAGENLSIELRRTPDILAALGSSKKPGQVLVGFALEATNEIEYGKDKLQRKNCDMVIVNTANKERSGFGGDDNTITILQRKGNEIEVQEYPPMSKKQCAEVIVGNITLALS